MANVEALYRRYGPMVARRCSGMLGSHERGLEAMQEVFMQVLKHYPDAPLEGSSSLLYRIATNVSLNLIRKERKSVALRDDVPIELILGDDDPAERSAERALLDRLFGRDDESSKVIAYCHFVDGMTLEEVAVVAGLSVSGVRKRIAKMRERARELTQGENHVTKPA